MASADEMADQMCPMCMLARRAPGGPPKAEPGVAPGRGGAQRSRLDQERKDFGPDYHDHGVLFCWENGKPPHPDTITRRFKKLARQADLPEIDLHDLRHSYTTAGRNAKIDWKALSRRIGHSDVAFTMKQYVQTDLDADREVANTLADLIIGGLLITGIED